MSDIDLLQQARHGDQRAFGRLVDRHEGLLCSVAYAVTGDLSLSQDATQEAFLAAWGRLDDLREEGKLRPWLCAIVRYKALGILRKLGRDPAASAQPLDQASLIPTDADTPRSKAIRREEEDLLWKAISHLPEPYRIPLVLRYRDQRDISEIAGALGLTPNTVKQRLFRARNMLRDDIAAWVEESLARTRKPGPLTPGVLAFLPEAHGFGLTAIANSGAGVALRNAISSMGATSAALATAGAVVLVAAVALGTLQKDSDTNPVHKPITQAAIVSIPADADATEASEESAAIPALDRAEEDAPPELVETFLTAQEESAARIAMAKKTLLEDHEGAAGLLTMKMRGWTALALMGDDYGRRRLLQTVHALNDKSHLANRFLVYHLGDTSGQEFLALIMSAEWRPLEERLAAYRMLRRAPDGSAPEIPETIERHFQQQFLKNPHAQSILEMPYTTDSRIQETLLDLLYAHAFDDTDTGTNGREGRGFGVARGSRSTGSLFSSMGGFGSTSSQCIADGVTKWLCKGDEILPTTLPALRDVARDGTASWVAFNAVKRAYEMGDEEFALDLMYKRVQSGNDPIDRLGYAFLLVKAGDDTQREVLYEGMDSLNPAVRVAAYRHLYRLGDDAFIVAAAADLDSESGAPRGMGNLHGEEWKRIREDLNESRAQHLHKMGKVGYYSDFYFDWLQTVLENAPDQTTVFSAFNEGDALRGSNAQLATLAPLVPDVFSEAPVLVAGADLKDRARRVRAMNQYVRALCLLRAGTDDQQQMAIQWLDRAYNAVREDENVLSDLVFQFSNYPPHTPALSPLLQEIIENTESAPIRIMAASALLQCEAGVVVQ